MGIIMCQQQRDVFLGLVAWIGHLSISSVKRECMG